MKEYVDNEDVRTQIWTGVFFERVINILQFLYGMVGLVRV